MSDPDLWALRDGTFLRRDNASSTLWLSSEGGNPPGRARPVSPSRTALIRAWVAKRDALAARRLEIRGETGSTLDDPTGWARHVWPLLVGRPITPDLHPFQRRGVAWLLSQPVAVLADDMGLGKTVQAIRALGILFRSGRASVALVVAPSSLVTNWVREFSAWEPALPIVELEGPPEAKVALFRRTGVCVANYEALRGLGDVIAAELRPHVLILDEAHRIKNSDTQHTQALGDSRPERLWALSGTPMDGDLDDLLGLMRFLLPNRFSDRDSLRSPSETRARIRPFVLRRQKEEVLSDLPPVQTVVVEVPLSEIQKREYAAALREAHREEFELVSFNRLRELCDFDPNSGTSSKVNKALDIVHQHSARDEKVVVFSYTLAPLALLGEKLNEAASVKWAAMTGDTPIEDRQAVVDEFQNGATDVLLLSLRVGGEGLTLTSGTVVILLNEWWNPSLNAQAVDRVHRIGQQRPVTVYSLRTPGTVEERLTAILDRKEQLFSNVVEELAEAVEGKGN